jgi:manganese transport protein
MRMLQKVSPERPEEPAMRQVLDGHRRGLSGLLPFAGPAIVVSVAYIDPGNFATNIQAGARYGYALLWVVLMANLVAMLFQSLSARLGIVTGYSLAEVCRANLPRPLVYVMWVVSELAAMATDLAEFLGGAIGLSLLFNLPLLVGMGITGIVTYALLLLEGRGYRSLELAIGAMVGVVGLAYLAELFIAPIGWKTLGQQIFVPNLPDSMAVAITVGIIGATVMPHALFLHSGLTERRARPKTTDERRRIIRVSNLEVVLALSVAGLINLAMVVMAAGAFHGSHPDVAKIETAYLTLVPLLGGAAATIFLISLIASGFSSSVVGTMAGQMIMQGFVNFHIPIWVRRAVTMLPSFAVVIAGVDATRALVLSQVALSIALPFPMIALVWFTSRRDIMGVFRNRPVVTMAAILASMIVLGLNIVLLLDTFGVISL